jgi:hypothetical protein
LQLTVFKSGKIVPEIFLFTENAGHLASAGWHFLRRLFANSFAGGHFTQILPSDVRNIHLAGAT